MRQNDESSDERDFNMYAIKAIGLITLLIVIGVVAR